MDKEIEVSVRVFLRVLCSTFIVVGFSVELSYDVAALFVSRLNLIVASTIIIIPGTAFLYLAH